MKYDGLRKTKRNQMLVKFKADNPELSLREIGEFFDGITKQAVSDILKREAKRRAYSKGG